MQSVAPCVAAYEWNTGIDTEALDLRHKDVFIGIALAANQAKTRSIMQLDMLASHQKGSYFKSGRMILITKRVESAISSTVL